MKRFKKMMAMVIAMAMMLSMMSLSAFATDATHSISLNSNDTHTYKVFQVLTGTLSEAGSQELGNPAWGADATTAAKQTDVNTFIASITAEGITEREIAALVAAKVDTSGNGRGTVNKNTPLEGLATGYYVLVDVTNPLGDNEEYSLNVVKVVNDITGFTVKHDTTSDEKKIVSDTLGKSGTEVNTINGTADNVSVGDTVNYQITAKIPATADDNYNYYYFVINDTLSEGLTFTKGSIKVYKDSISDTNLLTVGAENDYLVQYDTNNHTFEVGMVNARSLAGKNIIVTYSAVLNEKAKIGETGNDNTSTVTYSNNPNHDYNGGTTPGEPGDNPGFPNSTDKEVTGETPDSVTKTYTTGIEIQKVDQDGKPLTGAEFTLTGTSIKTVLTVAETFTADDNGDYYKLKNGKYTKEAPSNAQSMEEAEEGATEGYVEDANATGEGVITIGDKTYRPYVPAEDEGMTVYTLVNGTADQYEEGKYKKTVTKTATDVKETKSIAVTVDANGLARFDGLGAGTYTISETKTPSGYNTLADTTVTVSFDDTKTPKWSFTGAEYDSTEGIGKIEIENNKGTELPSTGGMGTTIFYIIGAILVIGAGVVMITRRRMEY